MKTTGYYYLVQLRQVPEPNYSEPQALICGKLLSNTLKLKNIHDKLTK